MQCVQNGVHDLHATTNTAREAIIVRRQDPDSPPDRAVAAWAAFTRRQLDRYLPAPADARRHCLPHSRSYRLRVMHISGLPRGAHEGRAFELGVSLYDETLGTFYGCTTYSLPDISERSTTPPEGMPAASSTTGEAVSTLEDVGFSFDVFFHSPIHDGRCKAVVGVLPGLRVIMGRGRQDRHGGAT